MKKTTAQDYDVVVVGGTPGGIMAAVAAAREGATVLLLERTAHLGGLPANGLGCTDIATQGATGGLYAEFIKRIREHYVTTYGAESAQATVCCNGLHFESSLAERVLEAMLGEQAAAVTVLRQLQFGALRERVTLEQGRVRRVEVLNRQTGQLEGYAGRVFIDATYEGDLAAAAGAAFRTRREGRHEYNEAAAGRIYKTWIGSEGEGSTGEGDDTIQAHNYRPAPFGLSFRISSRLAFRF